VILRFRASGAKWTHRRGVWGHYQGRVDAMVGTMRLAKAAAATAAILAAGTLAGPATGWAAVTRPAATRAVGAKPATTAAGTRQWAKRYSAAGASDDRPAEYPDATSGQPASYYGTIAYNASTGQQKWVEQFLGPATSVAAFANSIAVSPDGSEVFVTGQLNVGAPTMPSGQVQSMQYGTVAYNATNGHYLWSRLYKDPGFAYAAANAVSVTPDGKEVIVTGGTYADSSATADLDTVAYNATTGALLWTKRIAGGQATSIYVSPDSSTVYVAADGASWSPGFTTAALATATGKEQWISHAAGPDYPVKCSLAGSPDGTKVFTGCTNSDAQYLTLAYSAATGSELWHATYKHDSYATTLSGIAASDSQVFVTGSANGHQATVAYNSSTGSQQWAGLYPTPGGTASAAEAITLSPDGSTVYSTGG
jgi:hypothetical protein